MNTENLYQEFVGWSAGVGGPVHTVSTQQQLDAAVRALAASGGTIALDGDGGPYSIVMYNIEPSSMIVFTAADETRLPEIEEVVLWRSNNVALDGISMTQSEAGTAIRVTEAQNIAIINSVLKGQATEYLTEDGSVEKAKNAMDIRTSENVLVEGNSVSNFFQGITITNTKNLSVSNNEISEMQGDGLRGGGLQDATFAGNYMHDFLGSTQWVNHSDMIQLWSTNTTMLNRNIEISGNILDAGTGAATQSIFIRHDQLDTGAVPGIGMFDNISISNNVIHNAFYHGITVNHTTNLEVVNNTVLWNPGAATQDSIGDEWVSRMPTISLRNSPDAVLEGNIAGKFEITTDPNGHTYAVLTDSAGDGRSNFQVNYSDSGSYNYADAHFANLSAMGEKDFRDLLLRDDSPLSGVVGADLSTTLNFEAGSDQVSAVIAKQLIEGNTMGVELSAGFSRVGDTQIDPSESTVVWRFEDGTTAQGMEVSHLYDTPGEHQVVLEITGPSGQTDRLERTIYIEDPVLLNLDFEVGFSDTSAYGARIDAIGRSSAYTTGESGRAWSLNSSSKLAVERTSDHLVDLDSFDIHLGIQKVNAAGTGEIMALHGVMSLKALSGGALNFQLTTDQGTFSVTSQPDTFEDTLWHDINVQFDGVNETLSILVDGEVVAQGDASGHTTSVLHQPLTLGSPWSTTLASNVDTFSVSKLIPHLQEGYVPVATAETDGPQPVSSAPIIPSVLPDELGESEQTDAPSPVTPATTVLDIDPEESLPIYPTFNGAYSAENYTNVLVGNAGSNPIAGTSVDDWINGADGRDDIFGGAGNDFIIAGPGFDWWVRGGSGSDVFQFGLGDQGVKIADWEDGKDLIALADGLAYSDLIRTVQEYQGRQSVVYSSTQGDRLIFDTVDPNTIDAADFVSLESGPQDTIESLVAYSDPATHDVTPEPTLVPEEDLEPQVEANPIVDAAPEDDTAEPVAPAIDPSVAALFPEQERDLLLKVDFSEGGADQSGRQAVVTVHDNGNDVFTDGIEGAAFLLDGQSDFEINASNGLLQSVDNFELTFDFRKDDEDSVGVVMRQHSVLDLRMHEDGRLLLKLHTEEGTFFASTSNGVINDTDWHNIKLSYDDTSNVLEIEVDGAVEASSYASGRTGDFPHWGLFVGNPWGDSVEASVDNLLFSQDNSGGEDEFNPLSDSVEAW